MAEPARHTSPTGRESVERAIAAAEAASESVYASIETLTDAQAREASLLPGWTRGHVLTHIARNADGLVNLVTWARTGVETPMYPSRDQRAADIEAGSGRPAVQLVEDVHESGDRLLAELREAPDDTWGRMVRFGGRDLATNGAHIPYLRRVELEVHHVDLNLDYTLAHLPEDLVERMLGEVTADFSADDDKPGVVLLGNESDGRWVVEPGGQEVSGPEPSLLGWLLGRTDGVGLHSDQPLPTLGAWR
jgi:maleylpyruvate isomerase